MGPRYGKPVADSLHLLLVSILVFTLPGIRVEFKADFPCLKVARIDPEAKGLGISHFYFRLLLFIPGKQLYTAT